MDGIGPSSGTGSLSRLRDVLRRYVLGRYGVKLDTRHVIRHVVARKCVFELKSGGNRPGINTITLSSQKHLDGGPTIRFKVALYP